MLHEVAEDPLHLQSASLSRPAHPAAIFEQKKSVIPLSSHTPFFRARIAEQCINLRKRSVGILKKRAGVLRRQKRKHDVGVIAAMEGGVGWENDREEPTGFAHHLGRYY